MGLKDLKGGTRPPRSSSSERSSRLRERRSSGGVPGVDNLIRIADDIGDVAEAITQAVSRIPKGMRGWIVDLINSAPEGVVPDEVPSPATPPAVKAVGDTRLP